MSQNGVEAITSIHGMDGLWFEFREGREIFCFPKSPDLLWGLLSHPFEGNSVPSPGAKRRGLKQAAQLHPMKRLRMSGFVRLLPWGELGGGVCCGTALQADGVNAICHSVNPFGPTGVLGSTQRLT